ncbi:MAG: winged helix-turn-helix transcriptional regulator [Planctomycetota bacterium]
MSSEPKKIEKIIPSNAAQIVETIFRCKWSLTVYSLLVKGIHRPGEMARSVDGLTKKVLHDCLNKNIEFGILERRAFSDAPPRVEYHLTSFGNKFLQVLKEIERLQDDLVQQSANRKGIQGP